VGFSRPSRWVLFYDPKPANYLAPSAAVEAGLAAGSVYRIDFDWMLVSSPVSHQAIMTLLTYPIFPIAPSDAASSLDAVCEQALGFARPFGAQREEMDLIACYHLFRNFAAKVRDYCVRGERSTRSIIENIGPYLLASLGALPGSLERPARELVEVHLRRVRQGSCRRRVRQGSCRD
jgi:hypothetical protein